MYGWQSGHVQNELARWVGYDGDRVLRMALIFGDGNNNGGECVHWEHKSVRVIMWTFSTCRA